MSSCEPCARRSWPALPMLRPEPCGINEAGVDAVVKDNVSETMPCGATEPSLCPGCHNHPSLKIPWRQLPEKVAASIEEFTDQLKSLWAKQIIDEGLYNKLYEFAASRYPPIFYTIRTGHHGPPLWTNYHNVKSSSGFLQIGCTRCRKVTPQLWTKG